MNAANALGYVDRSTGTLRQEEIYARGFLDWCYNSRPGRFLTDVLFRRRWLSRLYGWTQRMRWSRRRIRPFVERFGIDVDEIAKPLDEFESFAEFFVREIDLSKRSLCMDSHVCMAPVDGRMLAYPRVELDQTFTIKNSEFNLRRLLGDGDLASRYAGGSMLICRLYICDYHRVHFPDSGIPGEAVAIDGGLYAVSPYSRLRSVPFYSENHRVRSVFESDHFGSIAMVEIGAFTVGSIRQRHVPKAQVERAALKSMFELGGSTLVLLFEAGRIEFDDDLVTHTRDEIETYVRLGDSIGRRPI